jgi:hypothetical protein
LLPMAAEPCAKKSSIDCSSFEKSIALILREQPHAQCG